MRSPSRRCGLATEELISTVTPNYTTIVLLFFVALFELRHSIEILPGDCLDDQILVGVKNGA